MTKLFKNSKFVKREFDCTNVVYCEAEAAPNELWIEIEDVDFSENIQHLYTENNVKYYGYL